MDKTITPIGIRKMHVIIYAKHIETTKRLQKHTKIYSFLIRQDNFRYCTVEVESSPSA